MFVYDKQTEEGFDILRTEYGFTSTSAQHISKFIKDYKIDSVYRFDTEVRGIYYKRIK